MSLAVSRKAIARASWARRCRGRRSVLRRSCPKFDSHELVRSMAHRSPSETVLGAVAVPHGRFLALRVYVGLRVAGTGWGH